MPNIQEKVINAEKTKKRRETILLIVAIIALIGVLIGGIIGMVQYDRREYQKTIANPPSIGYVEEDLEDVFMTTYVVVIKEDNQVDQIFYTVEANGLTYKVKYGIYGNFLNFYWKYVAHIEIKGESV